MGTIRDSTSTFRKIAFPIVAVALGLTVAFAACEIIVRTIRPQSLGPSWFTYDNERGLIPVPDQHGRRCLKGTYDFTFSHNSLGLRCSRNYPSTKQKGTIRILLLGDSYTYGTGVNNEDTFAYLIEKSLSTATYPVEVINAGNPGKGTDYELRELTALSKKLKPDVVVLGFHFNDFGDNMRGDYYVLNDAGDLEPRTPQNPLKRMKNVMRFIPFYKWFLCNSHFAVFLKEFIANAIVNHSFVHPVNNTMTGESVAGSENQVPLKSVKTTGALLTRLKHDTLQSGSSFAVFYFPPRWEVAEYRLSGEISIYEKAIGGIASGLRQPLFSLTPALARELNMGNNLYLKEGHWAAAGHKVVADFMVLTLSNIVSIKIAEKESSL